MDIDVVVAEVVSAVGLAEEPTGHRRSAVHRRLGMPALYRVFEFEATHITMERHQTGPAEGPG